MIKPNTRRLMKLVKHLRTGKLAHKVFDFCVFNSGGVIGPVNVCGTNGCAHGEAPAVWPRLFKWEGGQVLLRKNSKLRSSCDACKFYGLTGFQFTNLFLPNHSGGILSMDATKFEVAAHIEQFCKQQRKENR